jgi:2-polyprenyl-3-methyl-5-hydroxy-6-metoxy-1,4-benzoquinol methylase
MRSRWLDTGVGGEAFDEAFAARQRAGHDVHGEADFVMGLAPTTVLDAGCGTGRVAVELARRGVKVSGVDLDPRMLDTAQRKAPHLEWHLADLADPDFDLARSFDVVVMAGNVLLFVARGTEAAVVHNLARHVAPSGALVAGFQVGPGYTLAEYDRQCADAGLQLAARYATWDRLPWRDGGDYAVSVHRRGAD